MTNAVEYDLSSRIENGVTIITFKKKIEVCGIIEVKGKFVARIGYNGTHHLGTFETREGAIAQRLLAEKHIKEGSFESWYKSIKKSGNSQ